MGAVTLVPTTAEAAFVSPPTPDAGAIVKGVVEVSESVGGTVTTPSAPTTPGGSSFKCSSTTRGKTGSSTLTIFRGSDATGRPYAASTIGNGLLDYNWDTARVPNGNYFIRVVITDRTVPSTPATNANCASVAVATDTRLVTVQHPGDVDTISGNGASGGTSTVSGRFVDASLNPATPFTVNPSSTATVDIMPSRTYTRTFNLGFSCVSTFGIGNTPVAIGEAGDKGEFDGGSPPQTMPPTTCAGTPQAPYAGNPMPQTGASGFSLLTQPSQPLTGFAPGITDGQTVSRYNRVSVKVFDSSNNPVNQTLDCFTVFQKAQSAAAQLVQVNDHFSGFGNCFSSATATGGFTTSSNVKEAHALPTITATVAGRSGTATPDPTTGLFSIDIDTSTLSAGPHDVTLTSSADDFLTQANRTFSLNFKGASVTTYTGPKNAFWDEDIPVSATVTDKVAPSALVSEGHVTFTLGSSHVTLPVTGGVASGALHAVDPPVDGQKIVATYVDDSVAASYAGSADDTTAFTTYPRPTTITYTGDHSGKFDSTAHFKAVLTDDRRSGNPVGSGFHVNFKLGDDDSVSAVTDSNGVAVATQVIDVPVGTHDVTAVFPKTATYVASSDTDQFTVDYQYSFKDTLLGNGGSVQLNPDTQQAGLIRANGQRTHIKQRAFQLSLYLPTVLAYPGTGLPPIELPQEWNILNLPRLSDLFVLLGPGTTTLPVLPPVSTTPPTIPTVPTTLPVLPIDLLGGLGIPLPMLGASQASAAASDSSGGIVLPNIGGGEATPAPATGNTTLGELIAGVTGAGIPTSLSACELLSGSTCERRFIVAAAVLNGTPQIVGVFDVKTGLFASVANFPGSGLALLASLGGCVDDLQLCIGVPALPSGAPDLASLIPLNLDPTGLAAAIESLAAQLQGLPDLVAAPPIPPTPTLPVDLAGLGGGSLPALPLGSLTTLIPTTWLG